MDDLQKAALDARAVGRSDLSAEAARVASGEAQQVFGPGESMVPSHPEEAEPRRWDYQPGRNIIPKPRAYEAISFGMLRALCDSYDIARLAIESRKGELRGLDWSIRPVPIKGLDRKERKKREEDLQDDVAVVETFWSSPNKEDDFGTWLSMYMEDLLVIDAATLYLRQAKGGGLYGLEVVDGATIKCLIDGWGRPPMPPEPSYVQVIKGVSWGEYTRQEMLYAPYHQRPTSPYGFPPMEWVMLTVNRALRRQTLDMSQFTEGTIPALWYKVPQTWTDTQLKELQEIFDRLLAGDDAARAKVRFVPGGEGTGPVPMYGEPKNEIEQWLMHVTASAFGTSAFELGFEPRGSGLGGAGFGEASRESRLARGTRPLARHLKRIIDQITAGPLGFPELEFAWEGLDDQTDMKAQAEADKHYWEMGALSTDELRDERLDKDPIGLGPTVAGQFVKLVEDLLDPPEPPPMALPPGAAVPGPSGTAREPRGGASAGRDAAGQDEGLDSATKDATGGDTTLDKMASTLSAWERKALRAVKDGRDPSRFVSDDIPPDMAAEIRDSLQRGVERDQVRAIFDMFKKAAAGGASARPLPTPSGHAESVISSATPQPSSASSKRSSMLGRTRLWRY